MMQVLCNRDAGRVLGTFSVAEQRLNETVTTLTDLGYTVTHIYDSAQKRMIHTPATVGSLLEEDSVKDVTYSELAVLTLAALVARAEGELGVSGGELERFAEAELELKQVRDEGGGVTWRLEETK